MWAVGSYSQRNLTGDKLYSTLSDPDLQGGCCQRQGQRRNLPGYYIDFNILLGGSVRWGGIALSRLEPSDAARKLVLMPRLACQKLLLPRRYRRSSRS